LSLVGRAENIPARTTHGYTPKKKKKKKFFMPHPLFQIISNQIYSLNK
jgi:hypothetical protein